MLKKKSRLKLTLKETGSIESVTDMETSVYFDKAGVDEPVPDELFTFVPPAGATRIVVKRK